ncbi:hypothetical protein ACRCRM_34025 [Pseudomonas aeruginosa]
MKTLDMVSPADPIDTTSSATDARRIPVLDPLAVLSQRLQALQLVWDANKVSSLEIKCHPEQSGSGLVRPWNPQ